VTDPASEPVQVGPGPDGLEKALLLLSMGAAFDLHGTTGPAGFDATRGVRAAPVRAFCWDERGELTDSDVYDTTLRDFSASGSECSARLSNGEVD
jgi:hypothetical protein